MREVPLVNEILVSHFYPTPSPHLNVVFFNTLTHFLLLSPLYEILTGVLDRLSTIIHKISEGNVSFRVK